jgi:hypothetical protein
LVIVWLDASDVRWVFANQNLHQVVDTLLELRPRSLWTLFAQQFPHGEDRLGDDVVGFGHDLDQVAEQEVVVLLNETLDAVGDVSCVVLQLEFLEGVEFCVIICALIFELVVYISGDSGLTLLVCFGVAQVVLVVSQIDVHFVEEAHVAGVSRPETFLVQEGNDSFGTQFIR